MIAKVNAHIQMKTSQILKVELWDEDVLSDDKIQLLTILKSGPVEFLFDLADTGEFNPELHLRIFDEAGNLLLKTAIDDSLNSLKVDKTTGFREKTTIDFGLIEI
jgi:hypothetical protein